MLPRDASPLAALGIGWIERRIVHPIVLRLVMFGGYLAGRAETETGPEAIPADRG